MLVDAAELTSPTQPLGNGLVINLPTLSTASSKSSPSNKSVLKSVLKLAPKLC